MSFSNPRQTETPESASSGMDSDHLKVPHLLRLRRVFRTASDARWKQRFRSRLPMLVLVHHGLLAVRRQGSTHCARAGDVVLITPGSFELSAVPAMRGGAVRLEYAKFPLSVIGSLLCRPSCVEVVALWGASEPDCGFYLQRQMLAKVLTDFQMMIGELRVLESIINTLALTYAPSDPEALVKRFFNLEAIPIANIVPLPTELPELLKAA